MSPSFSWIYPFWVSDLRTEEKWFAFGIPVTFNMYVVLGENDPSPLQPSRVRRTFASFPVHRLLTAMNKSVGYVTKVFGLSSLSWNTWGAILYFMLNLLSIHFVLSRGLYYVFWSLSSGFFTPPYMGFKSSPWGGDSENNKDLFMGMG